MTEHKDINVYRIFGSILAIPMLKENAEAYERVTEAVKSADISNGKIQILCTDTDMAVYNLVGVVVNIIVDLCGGGIPPHPDIEDKPIESIETLKLIPV